MYSASATSCTCDFPTSVAGSTSSQEKTVICPPNHSFGKYLKLLLVMDYGLFQSMEPQMAHPHATNSMEEHSRAANKWKQQKHSVQCIHGYPFSGLQLNSSQRGHCTNEGAADTSKGRECASDEEIPQRSGTLSQTQR